MSLQEFIPSPKFDEDKDFFDLARREDGVLLARAHTVGGPVQLSVQNHRAPGQFLKTVGADPENELLILTECRASRRPASSPLWSPSRLYQPPS